MRQHELIVNFKARYYTLGNITPATRQIWFVLHGYGQLAGFFIRKFNVLLEHDIFIVAPEGLSRFYLESPQQAPRSSDRVGATWMTKENRLADIENYLHYLNALFKKCVGSTNRAPVTILGFSQGAATVSRWVTDRAVSFDRLILWSGVFPPDMDFISGKKILQEKETFFVYGKNDPFINENGLAEMNMITAKLGIAPNIISFEGNHEIEEQTLLKFV